MATHVVEELQRRAAESPGGATVEILLEDLAAALKDAARYEWLREHWGALVTHTDYQPQSRQRMVTSIEPGPYYAVDPQSLDHAIDATMAREDFQAENAAPICECVQGVVVHNNPGLCGRCGRPLRAAP